MKHAILSLAVLAGAYRIAAAADLPCGPADRGTIELDGLTEDWKDVEGIDAGARDLNLSFTVKCNVEPNTLMLLVDVRDNYFVRTKAAKSGEDHLELTLAGKKLLLWPGNAAELKDKVAPAVKGMRTATALQPHGWAMELAIPLHEIPGFHPGNSTIKYALKADDCDSKASLRTERSVDTIGSIQFAEGQSNLEGFLKDRHLGAGDVFFDKNMRMGKKEGGRIVLAGKYAAAITDGFVYLELPFKERKDLKEARVIDLAGDNRDALVLRYFERGSGGAREVLAAYRFDGDNVRRVFAAEVGKFVGASKIEDKVGFVKRGRATDILIEAGTASGFDQASYKESPAADIAPILLPWGDDKKARYQFRGDEYLRQ